MKVNLTESQIKTISKNLQGWDDLAQELLENHKRDKSNDKKCGRIRRKFCDALHKIKNN